MFDSAARAATRLSPKSSSRLQASRSGAAPRVGRVGQAFEQGSAVFAFAAERSQFGGTVSWPDPDVSVGLKHLALLNALGCTSPGAEYVVRMGVHQVGATVHAGDGLPGGTRLLAAMRNCP